MKLIDELLPPGTHELAAFTAARSNDGLPPNVYACTLNGKDFWFLDRSKGLLGEPWHRVELRPDGYYYLIRSQFLTQACTVAGPYDDLFAALVVLRMSEATDG